MYVVKSDTTTVRGTPSSPTSPQNEEIDVVYGSRSGSDEAPLSDSEDRDHAVHDPEGVGGIGMELSGQVSDISDSPGDICSWWHALFSRPAAAYRSADWVNHSVALVACQKTQFTPCFQKTVVLGWLLHAAVRFPGRFRKLPTRTNHDTVNQAERQTQTTDTPHRVGRNFSSVFVTDCGVA